MTRTAATREYSRLGYLLLSLAAVLAAATIYVTADESPNRLAAGILQALGLMLGTGGSYLLGRVAASDTAMDIVRPHARSAFRRMRNLYGALGRQSRAIAGEQVRLEGLQDGNTPPQVDFEQVRASLNLLQAMVVEQISTADDALEDWRDLVPEEVAAIELTAGDVE